MNLRLFRVKFTQFLPIFNSLLRSEQLHVNWCTLISTYIVWLHKVGAVKYFFLQQTMTDGQFLSKLETLPKSAKRIRFCICHHILEKKSSSYNRKQPHFAQLLDDFLMNGSLRRIFGQFFINNTTARRNDDDEDHLFPRPLLSPFGLFPKEKIVVNYWPQTCSVASELQNVVTLPF